MPVLNNPRYETFAQARAAGQPIEHAYKNAGFRPSNSNCMRLEKHQGIVERIRELMMQRSNLELEAQRQAQRTLAITRQDVLQMLLDDHAMAKKANQLGPAVRATELLGKEIGMFIDRQLRKETADIYEGLSDEQLRELVMERIAKFRVLSAKEVSLAPEGLSGAAIDNTKG